MHYLTEGAVETLIYLHAFAVGLIAVSVVCGLSAVGIAAQAAWEWFCDR